MTSGNGSTLLEHLEALRQTLWRILIAVVLLFPAAYWATDPVLQELIRWTLPPEAGMLHYFTPMEAFLTELKLAFILTLIVSFPWNVWQLWRFLAPALYAHERRFVWGWLSAGTFLFLAGASLAVGAIMPLVMRFAYSFGSDRLRPMIGLESFVSLAGVLALAFGVMFQFPLVVMLLVRTGLVSVKTFRAGRPMVIVVIFILATVLTPPDVVSQLMLAFPTWLLFEIGLLCAARMAPKEEAPDEPGDESAVEDIYPELRKKTAKEK